MARLISVAQTPTITASSAYSSGNALGGLLTFSSAGLSGMGKILSVYVYDKAGQSIACDLLLFKESFTATTNKTAIAISSADLLNMIGAVSIVAGDYVSVGTGSIASKSLGYLGYVEGSVANLYGQLVTRGTPTYAAVSDITVRLVCVAENPGGA